MYSIQMTGDSEPWELKLPFILDPSHTPDQLTMTADFGFAAEFLELKSVIPGNYTIESEDISAAGAISAGFYTLTL